MSGILQRSPYCVVGISACARVVEPLIWGGGLCTSVRVGWVVREGMHRQARYRTVNGSRASTAATAVSGKDISYNCESRHLRGEREEACHSVEIAISYML